MFPRVCLFACAFLFSARGVSSNTKMHSTMVAKESAWSGLSLEPRMSTLTNGEAVCVGGTASEYNCSGINLHSTISLTDLGCVGIGNDLWGWTDADGREIALVGCSNGVSFVDVSAPNQPLGVGFLPTHSVSSDWRDMKVYNDHVFVGSEASNHGIQVFNLRLITSALEQYAADQSAFVVISSSSGLKRLDVTYAESAWYGGVGSSHNVVINENTGFLYIVGSRTCSGGLHIVNIADPLNPTYVTCHGTNGYVHDAQCVIYTGPDSRHTGKELCFTFNEDHFVIVDVTDKSNIFNLAYVSYEGYGYTHQGWLTEDMRYVLMDDELDEILATSGDQHTRTLVWNVEDLEMPILAHQVFSTETVIDHNQYTHRGFSWQSNYCGGLRVLDLRSMNDTIPPHEVAYFDVSPDCASATWDSWYGSWSVYPFFASGNIAVNSIERGLFMLHPVADVFAPVPEEPTCSNNKTFIKITTMRIAGSGVV